MQAFEKLPIKHLNVKLLNKEARLPTRAHSGDAGLDLYCDQDFIIESGQGRAIRTGIAMAIPEGFVGLVADRSSLAKKGLKTAGGVIDSGYRGEVHILLWNVSSEAVEVKRGDRVAQLLVLPVALCTPVEAFQLDETNRGSGGFGSTGR